ncbi:hypothetical protein M4R22_07145 [Acidovorax sp. GBBC 3334]|uniref:hypothetical protein n=1 Tax=Acidovorax sp. GBBC 3334 TaxID=2940496 RepID=UPI00230496E4|nr:hypothetical protein [Acidovorax sp. GBBC 3334]MDA8454532.1 hypothetical protein [Acidovorax sp. GBBC 3334]
MSNPSFDFSASQVHEEDVPAQSVARPGFLALGAVVIAFQVAAMAWVLEDHVRHAAQQQASWVARGMQAPAGIQASSGVPTVQADGGVPGQSLAVLR